MIHRTLLACGLAALLAPGASAEIAADWARPSVEEAEAAAVAWLDQASVDDEAKSSAIAVLRAAVAAAPDDLASASAAVIAAVDPAARVLLAECESAAPPSPATVETYLAQADPFAAAQLRLLVGRRYVQDRMFDEALALLDGLRPADVLDPAALLFYEGVVRQRLLDRDGGLAAARRLLQRRDEIPRRYAVIADLIDADLLQLEDESLDHISRRMQDVSRRLDLGRSNDKVREIEQGVVDSLDKLIKQAEDQLQQMQQQAAAGQAGGPASGNLRPSQPAQDSTPLGGRGPGEVEDKPIGDAAGWGDLDPKRRQEVLQQIGREYPAHYREVIEQYFRRLAQSPGDSE